jgi:hypothetical protein
VARGDGPKGLIGKLRERRQIHIQTPQRIRRSPRSRPRRLGPSSRPPVLSQPNSQYRLLAGYPAGPLVSLASRHAPHASTVASTVPILATLPGLSRWYGRPALT